MNNFKLRGLAVLAAACTVMAFPTFASAQETTIKGVFFNRVSYKNFVHDVERQSNEFRALYEKRYREMFLPNFRKSDRVRDAVQDLDKSIEIIYKRSLVTKPQYIRDDVAKVIKNARVVDMMMAHPDKVLGTMDSEWADLKRSINDLAGVYDLPDVDG